MTQIFAVLQKWININGRGLSNDPWIAQISPRRIKGRKREGKEKGRRREERKGGAHCLFLSNRLMDYRVSSMMWGLSSN
jgi:hypothetical protein